ncbi:hypothetical protein JAAARDRAFT_404326 [Jaapia argillacea MUCL 33604]|uniref:F-box domain-containing protein n=1 Tax=Jaapia argillacea MUCL 33604 TaxID=933084 RepID=A0A067PHA5_9AGAM|nr:hypothetical protein JAAARDRAFT_404326 [Jaapia argillacea MUCL 33604]
MSDMKPKTPVDKLPNEILADIFVICLEEEEGVAFPITASHVSRYWRTVSLGTPALWSRISVSLLQRPLLDIYLTRSSSQSLDIVLRFNLPETWRYGGTDSELISLPDYRQRIVVTMSHSITRHIGRCRSFAFTADNPQVTGTVLRSLENVAAPQLTSLCLEFSLRILRNVFGGGTPLLSTLSLTSVWYSDPWVVPLLPHLTFLTLKTTPDMPKLSDRDFCKLLAECPLLRQLSLDGIPFTTLVASLSPNTSRGAHLAFLQSLNISHFTLLPFDTRACASRLSQILSIPQLESLSFSNSSQGLVSSFVDGIMITNLDREWAPNLTSLSLVDVQISRPAAISLARCFSRIRELKLIGKSPYSALLSSVIPGNGHDAMWPELKVLTLARTMTTWSQLSDLLLNRNRIGFPLQRVRIDRYGYWTGDGVPGVPTEIELFHPLSPQFMTA